MTVSWAPAFVDADPCGVTPCAAEHDATIALVTTAATGRPYARQVRHLRSEHGESELVRRARWLAAQIADQ
jgi:hypothetical protein